MKVLKISAFVIAVLLAAALIAPMALRGKIADIVRREANDMLQAKLDFESLDISLLRHFPHASLELKGLTLVGVERFEGDTIVAVKRISVVVDLWSLMGDEGFEVTKLFVASPSVHARKLADGAVNWDVMKPSEQTPGQPSESASEATSQSSETAEPSSFRLSVRDVRISDAAVRFEDDSTHLQFATTGASLRLKGNLSAAQSDLDLRLGAGEVRLVSGAVPLLSGAEAELEARIEADLEKQHFTFSDNLLRINAIEMSLDGWAELREDAIAMDIQAKCDKVQFKDVLSMIPAFYLRDFSGLSASGELQLSLWARGEMREAQLPAFELKLGVADGSFQYSSLPKAVTDIQIAAQVSNPGGVMDKTVVDVSRFGFQMAGNSLSATLHATNLVTDPALRAAVDGHIDLASIEQVYPLEKGVELRGQITADVKAAGRLSAIERGNYEQVEASGSFVVETLNARLGDLPEIYIRRAAATITPSSMTLGELAVTVGKSDLTANGQLTGYLGYLMRGSELSGRLYVKSELLDLNEFMAAGQTVEPAETTAAPTAATTDTTPAAVLEVPRNLNLSFRAELRKILFAKMTVTDLAGEMRARNGALSLEGLHMGLFGGKATASGSYSTAVSAARPELKMSLGLSGASFARTFEELETVQKLVPLFAKTGGDYSLSLDLSTMLDAGMSADLKTLDASGELRSENIKIQQLEVFDAMAKVVGNDALRRIEARDIAIRFTIREGRITTQPFDLKMGGVTVDLSGSTGLDQTIDYTARVSLPASATGGVLSALNLGIGGTFSAPKITLGVKEAAEEAVKNVIDQQIQKLTGSESLSAEVQKQAARLREEAQRAGEKLVAAAETQRTKLVEAVAEKGALAKIAAQKAGDKLVSEARKQAGKLTAEAEKQIEKLTQGTQK